jgi:nucleoside phosphorylase
LILDRLRSFLAVAAILLVPANLSRADTAVLVALPSEQSALSREVRIVGQSVELAQHRVSIGYHKGEKLYLVRTGAGNLNSAMVTQALLTRYKIDRIISVGVAGYIGDGGNGTTEILRQAQDDNAVRKTDPWRIGDIFIATNVVNHQEGTETPGGFQPAEKLASTQSRSAEYWKKCEVLRSNAVEITRALLGNSPAPRTNDTTETLRQAQGDKVGEGPNADGRRGIASIREGRLVSGDSFIASTAKRKWLRETFHADAVDMVSAGIARVCEANGVPCVIIRTLSDNADESASAAFAKFVQSGKEKEPVTVPIALRLIEQVAPPHP